MERCTVTIADPMSAVCACGHENGRHLGATSNRDQICVACIVERVDQLEADTYNDGRYPLIGALIIVAGAIAFWAGVIWLLGRFL